MSDLFVPILIFVVSLAVLIKSSDLFTDAAERLGLLVGLPAFIVGVTIVSLGTSLPELISSVIAVSQGASEVVVSNVVGSNIANICLVLGLASIVNAKSLQITYDLVSVDLPLFVGSALLLMLMLWDQDFSRGEAFLLLLGYVVYLIYILRSSHSATPPPMETGQESEVDDLMPDQYGASYAVKQTALLLGSGVFLFLGAQYTINSLISISEILSIGTEIIAVSAVAFGTSLPELIVTVNATRKGKAELAVGNVLGSNIFNIFMVMGIPGLMGSLIIPRGIMAVGMPTLISVTLLLFFATQDKKLTIWEGWLFFIMYAWFIAQNFDWI